MIHVYTIMRFIATLGAFSLLKDQFGNNWEGYFTSFNFWILVALIFLQAESNAKYEKLQIKIN